MLNIIAEVYTRGPLGDITIMAYLFALQSISAFATAGLWLRVWMQPAGDRLSAAAIATAVLLFISALRLSAAVVLRSGV